MWLIFCTPNDAAAHWACDGLKAKGLQPLELVTSDALANALVWKHQLGIDNSSTEITLADGRSIRSENIQGTLNRISVVPISHQSVASQADYDYSWQEFNAFSLSWIASLPGPMLNRPTPHGLSGRWMHISEWIRLASLSGLHTPFYRQGSSLSSGRVGEETTLPREGTIKTALVIGEHVISEDAPIDVLDGCKRLAEMAGMGILGVDFTVDQQGDWVFAGASHAPDLRIGAHATLDVLLEALMSPVLVA